MQYSVITQKWMIFLFVTMSIDLEVIMPNSTYQKQKSLYNFNYIECKGKNNKRKP